MNAQRVFETFQIVLIDLLGRFEIRRHARLGLLIDLFADHQHADDAVTRDGIRMATEKLLVRRALMLDLAILSLEAMIGIRYRIANLGEIHGPNQKPDQNVALP